MEPHLVQLDRDHPGFRDLSYRARRDAIAQLGHAHRRGDPAPFVPYTDDEAGVWHTALEALGPLHARHASERYRAAWPRLGFHPTRLPQLADVANVLQDISGFTYAPVAGLVTPRVFMESLADHTFLATQYMRHHSAPLYTPEPDVIHELVGHAPLLADERHARVNRLFGEATRVADENTIEQLIRAYWYGLEFGVARSRGGGALVVVGAGLLSSFGELGRFQQAELRPWTLEDVVRTPFDPTQYQSTLFVAQSEESLLDTLESWLTGLVRNGPRST